MSSIDWAQEDDAMKKQLLIGVVALSLSCFGLASAGFAAPFWIHTTNVNGSYYLIDGASSSIISTVPVGEPLIGLAVTPSGSRAYVAGSAGGVTTIDPAAGASIGALTLPTPAQQDLIIDPSGASLYVPSRVGASGKVYVFNTASNAQTATIDGIDPTPTGMAFLPDGSRLYVADGNSHRIFAINPATNSVISSFGSLGLEPQGIAVSADGGYLWVPNHNSGNVTVFRTTDHSSVANIPVATPFAVALTPDGTKAYVATENSNSVVVIDATTYTPLSSIPVTSPQDVVVTADGSIAYVAASGSIKAIGTSTDTVIGSIVTGGGNQRIALSAVNETAAPVPGPGALLTVSLSIVTCVLWRGRWLYSA